MFRSVTKIISFKLSSAVTIFRGNHFTKGIACCRPCNMLLLLPVLSRCRHVENGILAIVDNTITRAPLAKMASPSSEYLGPVHNIQHSARTCVKIFQKELWAKKLHRFFELNLLWYWYFNDLFINSLISFNHCVHWLFSLVIYPY